VSLSRLEELWKLAKLGQLHKDPLTTQALLATALLPESTEQLRRYFSSRAVPGIITPFQAGHGPGQLGLGFRHGDKPVGISYEDLNRHLVVAGTTGSGKTNWLNFFTAQLLANDKKVIWLDLKNEARHLVKDHPDLWVFRMEDFRWNPLEVPQGVKPKHWLNVFASVYAHAFSILHASEGAILQYVDDLYQQYGVYDGSGKFPCLQDLADHYGPTADFIGEFRRRQVANQVQYSLIDRRPEVRMIQCRERGIPPLGLWYPGREPLVAKVAGAAEWPAPLGLVAGTLLGTKSQLTGGE